jgi:gas vesicle protein
VGYIRGLIHGTVVGAVVGVCIAPQEGRRTREQIQSAAIAARDGAHQVVEAARRVAPTAQMAARQVGEVVGSVKGRVVHRRDEADDLISVNGGATVR